MRWMKPEPIIQNEESQKDKDQYSILTHIYRIKKKCNDNPICKTEKEIQMCGRRQGWDVLRKQHCNKYTIKDETDHQPRLDA